MHKNTFKKYIIFFSLLVLVGLFLYMYQNKESNTTSVNSSLINTIRENASSFVEKIDTQISSTSNMTNKNINQETEQISNSVTTLPAIKLSTGTEIMAWIYPGDPSCNASVEITDGRKLDVLKAEYFNITNDGQLKLLTTDEGCNGYSTKNIELLKKYSTSQYVTVSSNNKESMSLFFAQGMNVAVETLVSFVVENKITGVELDFEDFSAWSQEDYVSYKKFVTLLGNDLHANSKKLIIDGPAVSNSIEENWYVWRYQDFISLPVDQVVIMAYDYQFDQGVGSPVAPLLWIKNIITWTSQKYPNKNKLVIGLPSYGYRGTEGTHKTTLLTYEQIQKESGFKTAKRDPSSGEMTWKSGDIQYFYQDSESLRQKRMVVEELGIKSISVWHLGGNKWFK